VGERVWITHFFYFQGDKPLQAERELKAEGWPEIIVDEEVSGDGHWHIAAFRVETPHEADEARTILRRLASRHSGRYDGWHVTRRST
jgi:hypothetical protein